MGRHEPEEYLVPKSLVGIYIGSMWNEDVSYGLFIFDERGTRMAIMKVWITCDTSIALGFMLWGTECLESRFRDLKN